jgi:mannosyltransferase OCH1-like enzyme
MPAHLAAYGETWAQHHPGWEHRLWTEANMPRLRNQRLYDAAERIAPRNVGQLRADVARYEILLEHGGVYVDCDMECLRPLDPLLTPGMSCFAGWETPGRWVNNAVLGASPAHPFLGELVERLARNVVAHCDARPNVMSGPQYLTPIYRRHADTVTVFPKEHFYPYLWSELERIDETFPDSYAVHHWHNRRTNHA